MAGKYYDKDLCAGTSCTECCGCEQYDKALKFVIEHLEDVENTIVTQRNNSKKGANSETVIGMQMAIEDTLGWLKDQF